MNEPRLGRSVQTCSGIFKQVLLHDLLVSDLGRRTHSRCNLLLACPWLLPSPSHWRRLDSRRQPLPSNPVRGDWARRPPVPDNRPSQNKIIFTWRQHTNTCLRAERLHPQPLHHERATGCCALLRPQNLGRFF